MENIFKRHLESTLSCYQLTLTSSCPKNVFIDSLWSIIYGIISSEYVTDLNIEMPTQKLSWLADRECPKYQTEEGFFIFQPFQFFQDMTTLIHKNGCHSYIREFILIDGGLVDHGRLVIVLMVVVNVMLMIGHGVQD